MRLNTQVVAERDFAKWQLEIGHGKHTDEAGNIKLPDHFKCTENSVSSLISTIYPGVNELPHPPDHYFAERTILTSRNDDVDDINEKMLSEFPGDMSDFLSADSVKSSNENAEGELLYPVEYLNSINCSGLPLHKLQLKVGCPVMILRNLNPGKGSAMGLEEL